MHLTLTKEIGTKELNQFFSTCGDHVLTNIHNAAVHAQTVCNITETISSPLLHALEATIVSHEKKLLEVNDANDKLKAKIKALQQQLASKTESTSDEEKN